jgi:hypothetical protein
VANYITNRGKKLILTASFAASWRTAALDGSDAPTGAPANLYMALASAMPGTDWRDIVLTTDAGITLLTSGVNGYTPFALARNTTVFPSSNSDTTNDQNSIAINATISWTAAGGSIAALAALLIDGDQSAARNVLAVYDFGGTQTATFGNPFTIQNTTLRLTKAFGET